MAVNLADNELDTTIETLGPAKIEFPLKQNQSLGVEGLEQFKIFISDSTRVLKDIEVHCSMEVNETDTKPVTFEMAGPRKEIYFDPTKVKAAVVTAGGLCPGLNDVVRSIVLTLYHLYGVRNILGVKFGFQGLIPSFKHELLEMTPAFVSDIHDLGGTVLSSSRGLYSITEIVDSLERLNINMLFTIGGDGTLKGANKISEEIKKRNLKIAVVGVPKTIDNDINLVARSFGFDTATEAAAEVIRSAHTEALGAPNGIGLVKLMGRDSGFIAANAALAEREVNYVLIPEADFDLEGEQGLLKELERRLKLRGHAVIVVAEGAGQKFFPDMKEEHDASGNKKRGDIGVFLAGRIKAYFKEKKMEINLKYIDPSYLIRSRPASSSDSIFCGFLGAKAVHAAMAGKTNVLISQWNNVFIHVPIKAAIASRKKVNLQGMLWHSVLECNGQPPLINRQ
ncbi:MAG: ATP-dependent 6-phosphofructokinase [Deltaproteobacteria bacterium]|nr:ATP-dependent 6-phosphofructokinase [Deltaproteobacteria bacterium]MBW2140642.1 ATP-dependent 6-phosphofructokinase [Deltaproteobacteria bacterium]MBW2322451.1 ATP-dependent 6-phosphofructokinase [Deltaproteobacteria bacterium]